MTLNKIKDSLRRLLILNNLWVGQVTEKNILLDFLRFVRPIKTNHELIRVGGETDGGYLIPNDIDDIDACFSPGVSTTSNFEDELAKRGIKCFLADYSVNSPPINNLLFDFEKKYLGSLDNNIYMTLENWIASKSPYIKNAILQMDIEGSEYSVIFDTPSEVLRKFKIIVIEFHWLDKLLNKMGFELINLAFTKILKDFEVVHVHPNNCESPIKFKNLLIPPVMEFTFLRKDRCLHKSPIDSFPHVLDRVNNSSNFDYALPDCWYKSNY